MTRRLLSDEIKVEPRDSKYTIDELIDLCSRKDITQNGSTSDDLIEVALCLANEIKRNRMVIDVLKASIEQGLKPDEIKGVFLALEQMESKGKVTTEEKRRLKIDVDNTAL